MILYIILIFFNHIRHIRFQIFDFRFQICDWVTELVEVRSPSLSKYQVFELKVRCPTDFVGIGIVMLGKKS